MDRTHALELLSRSKADLPVRFSAPFYLEDMFGWPVNLVTGIEAERVNV